MEKRSWNTQMNFLGVPVKALTVVCALLCWCPQSQRTQLPPCSAAPLAVEKKGEEFWELA